MIGETVDSDEQEDEKVVVALLQAGAPLGKSLIGAHASVQCKVIELRRAAVILETAAEQIAQRRSVFASARQNPGAPDKVAFLVEMIPCWRTLTGMKRIPRSMDYRKNAFLLFVEQAWQDWKGEDATKNTVSFAAAYRRYRKSLDAGDRPAKSS